VVAHFTGHPKPTSAKRRLLELVRRPGAPGLACMNTNFGSCGKWAEYYCDIRRHSRRLSPDLKDQLKNTGHCCLPKFSSGLDKRAARKLGYATCMECPATLKIWASDPNLTFVGGVYVKTTLPSRKFNGGRPIYLNQDSDLRHAPLYLFFMQQHLAWSIGLDYRINNAFGYAGMEAQCPRDTKYWNFHDGVQFNRKHLNIIGHRNGHRAPNDTDHIAWNIHSKRWERERIFWEDGHLGRTDDASASGAEGSEGGSEGEAKNTTEEEEASDVQNGTADSADDEDLANGTGQADPDADEGGNITDLDADEKETAADEKKVETAAADEAADAEDDAQGGGEE
jgi:hypothetical protein